MARSFSKLSIVYWNAHSIQNKQIEFFNYLSDYQIDIACISETWLNSQCSFNHPDYCIYRMDRTVNSKDGVAIVINKNIPHTPMS